MAGRREKQSRGHRARQKWRTDAQMQLIFTHAADDGRAVAAAAAAGSIAIANYGVHSLPFQCAIWGSLFLAAQLKRWRCVPVSEATLESGPVWSEYSLVS